MRFVTKVLATLALAGFAVAAHDAGYVSETSRQRRENFTEALVLQEPPLGLPSTYFYLWESRLDPKAYEGHMEWKKVLALQEKLRKIGPGDEGRLDELVYVVKNVENNAREDAVRAIARIGSAKAKDKLYSILVEDMATPPPKVVNGTTVPSANVYGIVAGTATEELYRIGPEMAVDAIIRGRGWADQQINILIDFGDERSLRYLISKGDSYAIVKFLRKNSRKKYIAKYNGPMIRLFEKSLRGGKPEGYDYFCDEQNLEIYGNAIGSFNRDYLRGSVLPGIRDSCSGGLGKRQS